MDSQESPAKGVTVQMDLDRVGKPSEEELMRADYILNGDRKAFPDLEAAVSNAKDEFEQRRIEQESSSELRKKLADEQAKLVVRIYLARLKIDTEYENLAYDFNRQAFPIRLETPCTTQFCFWGAIGVFPAIMVGDVALYGLPVTSRLNLDPMFEQASPGIREECPRALASNTSTAQEVLMCLFSVYWLKSEPGEAEKIRKSFDTLGWPKYLDVYYHYYTGTKDITVAATTFKHLPVAEVMAVRLANDGYAHSAFSSKAYPTAKFYGMPLDSTGRSVIPQGSQPAGEASSSQSETDKSAKGEIK